MFEENSTPRPDVDALTAFAEQLAEIRVHTAAAGDGEITPETIVRWADKVSHSSP